MKKFSKICLAALLSGGIAYAANNSYIGFGGMIGNGTQSVTYNGDTDSANYNMSGMGFKFGVITKSKNRVEFSLNQLDGHNENGSDTYTGFEMNYLITFMNEHSFNPYVGLGVGYYVSKNMIGTDVDTGKEEHAKSVSLGCSVGLIYNLTDKIEIESALQYRHLSWNFVNYDVTDDIKNLYVGANYKF